MCGAGACLDAWDRLGVAPGPGVVSCTAEGRLPFSKELGAGALATAGPRTPKLSRGVVCCIGHGTGTGAGSRRLAGARPAGAGVVAVGLLLHTSVAGCWTGTDTAGNG